MRGTQKAKPTVEQGYSMACFKYQAGRFAESAAICRQILRVTPNHRDTLLLLAILAQRSGETAAGDEWFRQSVESREFSVTIFNKLDPRPRWSPHEKISALLEPDLDRYGEMLSSFERYLPWLEKISFDADPAQPTAPYWNNVWMPVLDAVTLYSLVAAKRPRYYVEIGSGNSTKIVARAIADHGLETRIVSIDPQPRAEIDSLCDRVLRTPLEKCDLDIFGELDESDIVFADNSHQSFMNSDVTVFFCEVFPMLAPGVTVGVHDIFLPQDYPEDWSGRYYSEQDPLACYLLAETQRFAVRLPVHFSASRGLGKSLMAQVRNRGEDAVWRTGTSFWLEMR